MSDLAGGGDLGRNRVGGAVVTDASNFHKGLRSRAAIAEGDAKRLRDKLDAAERELAVAKKRIPAAVLDGLLNLVAFIEAGEAIDGLSAREQRDVERACAWVREQFK